MCEGCRLCRTAASPRCNASQAPSPRTSRRRTWPVFAAPELLQPVFSGAAGQHAMAIAAAILPVVKFPDSSLADTWFNSCNCHTMHYHDIVSQSQ